MKACSFENLTSYQQKLRDTPLYLSFDDVSILPGTSQVVPSEVSLKTSITERLKLAVPLMLAPMKCIFNSEIAVKIAEAGGVAAVPSMPVDCATILISDIKSRRIDHHLYPNASVDAENRPLIGASISIKLANEVGKLIERGADFILLETAHADHVRVAEVASFIKTELDCGLIVGNIATPEAAVRFAEMHVDAIKVGIGQGSICTTSRITGVGAPLLTTIARVADALRHHDVRIIADGGIRNSGDIVKSLAVGADAACLGNLFARAVEASGETRVIDGIQHRRYSANPYESLEIASKTGIQDVDEFLMQHPERQLWVEGASGWVPIVGPMHFVAMTLCRGLQGGLGYVGASNICELRERVQFIRISASSQQLAKAHSLSTTEVNCD